MRYPNARLLRRLYDPGARRKTDDLPDEGGAADLGGLQLTLIVLAIYTGLLGVVFLIAQDFAVAMLAIVIDDPVVYHQWGVALLILAAFAGLIASSPAHYRKLLAVPLLGLALDTLVLLYDLASGASGVRQLGAPVLINLLLLSSLAFFYRRGQVS
jgi:hypothetical protein